MKHVSILAICSLLIHLQLQTSYKPKSKPFAISKKTTEKLNRQVQEYTRQQEITSCAQQLRKKYIDLVQHDKDYHKLYLFLKKQVPRLKYYLNSTGAQYAPEMLQQNTQDLIRYSRQCVILLQAKRSKTLHDISILEQKLDALMP